MTVMIERNGAVPTPGADRSVNDLLRTSHANRLANKHIQHRNVVKPTLPPMDMLDAVIAVDCSDDEDILLRAYSVLLANGVAYSLQGRVGRTARMYIEAGMLGEDGEIL